MSLKLKILFFCASLVLTLNAKAQNTNNSPYSQFGLGDYNPQYFAAQAGMGGIGVSNANGFNINSINPALLARNDKFAAFDLGVSVRSQKLTSQNKTQNSVSGTLQYISLAFPVTSQKPDTAKFHWTTGLTLTPYSNIYYKVVTNNVIDPGGLGSSTSYIKEGSGGLTRFDFNNGFKLRKRLYVGLKMSYIWGDITKQETASLSNIGFGNTIVNVGVGPTLIDRVNQHGFLFKLGSAYRRKIKEKLYFNTGATYELGSKLNATKIRYTQIPISNPPLSDTLSSTIGTTKLPSQYQIGFSFEDPYHWTIGADFTYQATASYVDYNGKSPLSNGYSFTVGGEYTPNIFSYTLSSRMTYRAGVNYSLTPITINNNQISDMSASLGSSMPIGRGNTMINLALSMGKRGSNAYVQENYFRVNFGVTINDQWFKRRKID